MATLKQCDRCKKTTHPAKIKSIIKLLNLTDGNDKNYISTEYELCEGCNKDFVDFISDMVPVPPRYSK